MRSGGKEGEVVRRVREEDVRRVGEEIVRRVGEEVVRRVGEEVVRRVGEEVVSRGGGLCYLESVPRLCYTCTIFGIASFCIILLLL